jgi:hypothetical protein
MMTPSHQVGATLTASGFVGGFLAWFLERIDAINSLLHFFLLVISIVVALVGAGKMLRK